MKEKMLHKKLNIAFSLVLVGLCAVLHIFVRPAYDDFYYVTFLDEGIKGFITATVEHYRTLSGRAFVHILLCPLLSFNMLPFKVFNVALICGLCAVISKFFEGFSKNFVATLSAFCLIGVSVLADGALWGAGSLNYLFPAFMIVTYSYVFNKSLSGRANFLVCILAFLAGATVEMSGILAVVCVIYFSVINKAKDKKAFVIANLICAALGYLTLFLSSGVGERLSGNEFYDIGLWERMISNFALFCGKICSLNGLSIIVILVLLAQAISSKNKGIKAISLVSLVLVALTAANVIYHSVFECAVSAIAFISMWSYAVSEFRQDRLTLYFTILLTLTLGVCVVSPVVGYRMLLPVAVYLICMLVSALSKTQIKATWVLAVPAAAALLVLIANYSANAQIIDENTQATQAFSGTELVIENVDDEMFGGGTVPSTQNFGGYYLDHYDIEDAKIEIKDEKIIRGGVEYVPIRKAAESGAKIDWVLACAEVTYKGETYRFSNGAFEADTGAFSVKLAHPVRIIDGTTYISEEDFEMLFE